LYIIGIHNLETFVCLDKRFTPEPVFKKNDIIVIVVNNIYYSFLCRMLATIEKVRRGTLEQAGEDKGDLIDETVQE